MDSGSTNNKVINSIIDIPSRIASWFLALGLVKQLLKNNVVLALFLAFIAIFFAFPSYDVAVVLNEHDENWNAIFLQGEEPFVEHNDLYGSQSHCTNLGFRFVPALILKYMGIRDIPSGLVFQFAAFLLFYYLLVRIFSKIYEDREKIFMYILPITLVMAGHVYASDYRGMFDTLALDFMLIAFLMRKNVFVLIPMLLAYYTDERAIIASPAILLYRLFELNSYKDFKSFTQGVFKQSNIILIVSWVLYFVIRTLLNMKFGLKTTDAKLNYFFDHTWKYFYTFYVGLEGFIIPLILVIGYLIKKKFNTFLGFFLLAYSAVYIAAQAVIDTNRSTSYLVLFLILLLCLFDEYFDKKFVFKVISWVVLISMAFDDFMPLLAQLYRMKFITNTI